MKQDVTWEETLTQMNVRLEVLNEKAKIRIEQIKRTMFKEDDGEKNFALLIDIAKQRMETIKKEYNTFFDRHQREYELICLAKESTKECLLLFNDLSASERVAFARCLSESLLPAWIHKIERNPLNEKNFLREKFDQVMYFYRIEMLLFLTEPTVDKNGMPKKKEVSKPDLKDVM